MKSQQPRGQSARNWLLSAFGVVLAAASGIAISSHFTHDSAQVLGQKFSAPVAQSAPSGNGGGGNGNGNNGNGNGNTGGGSPGKAFTMSVQAVGTIGPGQHQVLNVAINNPNNQDMVLTSATGNVKSVGKAGCLASWFSVETWAPGLAPTVVPANGTATIQMRLDFLDTTTNQDVCKSTAASPIHISYVLNATGRQA